MKKFVCFILTFVLLTTMVFADTDIPAFLTEDYTNYTENATIEVSLDNVDSIIALLDEMEITKDVSNYINLETFIKSIASDKSKYNIQVDIDKNFKKFKIACTQDGSQTINVNPNLNLDINTKNGLWLDIDISDDANPKFEYIISAPWFNKYFVINTSDMTTSDMQYIKSSLDKETIDEIKTLAINLISKYMKIEGSKNSYTLSINNDSFVALLNELYITLQVDYPDLPSLSFDGLKLLGDDGIKIKYNLKSGKITQVEETFDISTSLADISAKLFNEQWSYSSKGNIDFTIKAVANVEKIGSTTVAFPAITKENSFTPKDLEPEVESETIKEENVQYPIDHVFGCCDDLPVINDEVYVPFRQVLEIAYEDSVILNYDDGVITASCDDFPGFKTIKFTIDTDKIYTDNKEYSFGKTFTINGTTYISNRVFTELYGWYFSYAHHDILNNFYYYSFSTK